MLDCSVSSSRLGAEPRCQKGGELVVGQNACARDPRRCKQQLRRGALPRLEQLRPNPNTGERPPSTMRLERIAMEEVEKGLIEYDVPPQKAPEKQE